jgi:hypothetical protein
MSLKMSDSTYVAGTCNIGQKEIRRRVFVAVVGLVLSLSSLITMIFVSRNILAANGGSRGLCSIPQ